VEGVKWPIQGDSMVPFFMSLDAGSTEGALNRFALSWQNTATD
jgi:hypothetical protein